jgi:hypothetical protein
MDTRQLIAYHCPEGNTRGRFWFFTIWFESCVAGSRFKKTTIFHSYHTATSKTLPTAPSLRFLYLAFTSPLPEYQPAARPVNSPHSFLYSTNYHSGFAKLLSIYWLPRLYYWLISISIIGRMPRHTTVDNINTWTYHRLYWRHIIVTHRCYAYIEQETHTQPRLSLVISTDLPLEHHWRLVT